ncbi:hypothetical protein JCM17823_22600 [Halorubrum gandharaense]
MENISAFAVELLELLVLFVGAGAAALAGVALERVAFSAIATGDVATGLWALGMGAIALYIGVVALGYEQVLPRIRAVTDRS